MQMLFNYDMRGNNDENILEEDEIMEIHKENRAKKHILTIDNDFYRLNINEFKKNEVLILLSFLYLAQEHTQANKIRIDYYDYKKIFLKHLMKQRETNSEVIDVIKKACEKVISLRATTDNAIYNIFTTIKLLQETEEARPFIELTINKDFIYFFEDFEAGNFTKMIYEQIINLKAKSTQRFYLYLLHYKGKPDKNNYHRIQITKKQLIKELGLPEDETTSHIKRTIDNAVNNLKEILPELKYTITKKEHINKDGYKYTTNESYVFSWKSSKPENANNQYMSKEQEEQILKLMEEDRKKEQDKPKTEEEDRLQRMKERNSNDLSDLDEEDFEELLNQAIKENDALMA